MTHNSITADTRPAENTDFIKPEAEMSTAEKLFWGACFGFFMGGAWLLADWIRPLIYGA